MCDHPDEYRSGENLQGWGWGEEFGEKDLASYAGVRPAVENVMRAGTPCQPMEAPKLQSLRILAEARGWRMNTTPHQSLRDEAGKSIKDAIQALFPSAKINAPLPKEDQE